MTRGENTFTWEFDMKRNTNHLCIKVIKGNHYMNFTIEATKDYVKVKNNEINQWKNEKMQFEN